MIYSFMNDIEQKRKKNVFKQFEKICKFIQHI